MDPARELFEVLAPDDGPKLMRDRVTGETMHPGLGPRREAELLYLEPSRLVERLAEAESSPLVLLDVGLGAGSNAAAALRAARAGQRVLHMISFDVTLAALELALATDPTAFGWDAALLPAAQALCAQGRYDDSWVRWRVCVGDVRVTLAELAPASADLVYWDPFSPRSAPALWNASIFALLRSRCRSGASVHTYSAATATRAALLLGGFAVGKGPRAGDKQRSSTEAATQADALRDPLEPDWLRGLGTSQGALPADAPHDALARIAAAPQFARVPARVSQQRRNP